MTNINTIITRVKSVYPANKDEIWRQIKVENSLSDDIIEQLDLEFSKTHIRITPKSTSTEYEGMVVINSYQWNLRLQVNDTQTYLIYDFNDLCANGTIYDNITIDTATGTIEILPNNTIINAFYMIPNPTIDHIDNYFLKWFKIQCPIKIEEGIINIGSSFMDLCESFNQPLTLPVSLTSIGNYFMEGCSSFNQPLTLPASLTSIGFSFLSSCSSFNQPLTLSNSLTSIGDSFLSHCESFNQPLTLPASLTSIGTGFMFYCDNFTSTLRINKNITPEMFNPGDRSFATYNRNALVYTQGFKILYEHLDKLKERFPSGKIGSCYRNIVAAPLPQTTFIAKETKLRYDYHLNFVLGEHDIKVYLTRDNSIEMKFDKPISEILPDTSTGQMLIGNALPGLYKDDVTKTAIANKIVSIKFFRKKQDEQ